MTEPLKKGDLFHIVAASSPISNIEELNSGIKVLQEWGLICSKIDVINRSWGYLAGSDEVRFNELHPKNPNSYYGYTKLCKKLPPFFTNYFKEVEKLSQSDRPNYSKIKKLFKQELNPESFKQNIDYDWSVNE